MHPFVVKIQAALSTSDWRSVTSLVAVSGGADSVALMRGLQELQAERVGLGRLLVVHFNHGLRGLAAAADEAFVVNLASKFGLACVVGRASAADGITTGDSLEAAARDARYAFFRETADQCGARYLWTAHTADDQAETVLHRVLRGTGLSGLAGIPRVRPLSPLTTIVRPMLAVSRAEVLAYLQAIGQSYCEDATNADRAFTRNRLRHELLPLLQEQYNPRIGEVLRQLGALAGEAQEVIQAEVTKLSERACRFQPQGLLIDLPALRDVAPYLVRELFIYLWQSQAWPLQAMNFEKWHELSALALSSDDKTSIFPGHIRAQKKGEQLLLSRP